MDIIKAIQEHFQNLGDKLQKQSEFEHGFMKAFKQGHKPSPQAIEKFMSGMAMGPLPLSVKFVGGIGPIRAVMESQHGDERMLGKLRDLLPRVPKSAAEKAPNDIYVVYKHMGGGKIEPHGIFPSPNLARKFLKSHPEGRFMNYGTPRDIVNKYRSTPEDPEFLKYKTDEAVRFLTAANQNAPSLKSKNFYDVLAKILNKPKD